MYKCRENTGKVELEKKNRASAPWSGSAPESPQEDTDVGSVVFFCVILLKNKQTDETWLEVITESCSDDVVTRTQPAAVDALCHGKAAHALVGR